MISVFRLGSYALLSLSFMFNVFYAQIAHDETPFLERELLVMLDHGVDANKVWSEMNATIDFEVISIPSPSTGIYQLLVAPGSWDGALARFEGHRHVRAVQLNHTVSERETVPNDPSFGQQWHHVQSGDHDIDSDLAWDITTGGNAGNGARVVVAVLEGGGTNYMHTDLIDNHWVNAAEIPDNGIDDDGNGYVDDYNGWNSGNNTDNIGAGGHGTSVSRMIGATGDNGSGGVGVNWDIEIMQVDMPNGLSEANVVSSYEYPKVMRDIFNASGGEEGAFVVATNASWGIDQANPDNYPVWCAYYDELGLSGILNCGATTNSALNVDVVGDMPTACSSDYMVSVTATNSNDVRTFSGYGITTIDLGAPGDQVYLPSGTSGYGNTSGTSFASPCVAGAIGLVYSVPCPDLAELAISNPQGAADLVLGYIYEGTDLVPNLLTEVVTGGRLNVANSVNLALVGCGPVECDIESFEAEAFCEFNTETGGVETMAELTASFSNFLCQADIVCYRDTSMESWMCDLAENMDWNLSNGSSIILNGLQPNAGYEVYFAVDTLVSDTIMFMTPDCSALIPGCMDEAAYNYDPEATIDDGNCDFPCVDLVFTVTTDCWPDEVGWNITDEDGNVLAEVVAGTYEEDGMEEVWTGCVTYGCHTLNVTDEYGDGMFGSQWGSCEIDGNYSLTTPEGAIVVGMGDPDYGSAIEHPFCVPVVPGCTEEGTCNYDSEATANDGSCFAPGDACDDGDEMTVLDAFGEDCMCVGEEPIDGCLDETACNFSDEANVEDGSCTYVGQGMISGPVNPMTGTTQTYSYNGPVEHSYEWMITNGSFVGASSGVGLTSVDVMWEGIAGANADINVTETDTTGCSGSVEMSIDLLVNSISELNRLGMAAYPNPVTETLWITWEEPTAQGVELAVYNVAGQRVVNEVLRSTAHSIDCAGLAAGQYTLRLTGFETVAENVTFQFVVIH